MPKYTTKPDACKGCDAYEWGLGFVPPTGKPESPIAFVGQGPGEQEAIFSLPFYPRAPSGSMLDRWLNKAAKSRTQTIIANVVQCWLPKTKTDKLPKGNRMPTTNEITHCWHAHVGKFLHNSSAKFIVPIGAPSAKWFLGLDNTGAEKYIGTFTKLDLPEIRDGREREQNTSERELGRTGREPRATHEGPSESVHRADKLNTSNKPRTNGSPERPGGTRERDSELASELQPIDMRELSQALVGTEGDEAVSLLQRSLGAKHPRWIMPLMHPAAVVRGRWEQGPVQETFIARVLAHAFKNTEPELQDPTVPPPNTNLYPTLEDMRAFLSEVEELGAYALDIEEAGEHIICVGMTAIALTPPDEDAVILNKITDLAEDNLLFFPRDSNGIGTTVCLRFRKQGGGLYWGDWAEHVEAVKILQEILLLPVTKIFQNGITFDIPELAALGLRIVGPYIDTMHLAHTAYCELPKSLQFLATLYLGAPVWKTLVDTEELEGKG